VVSPPELVNQINSTITAKYSLFGSYKYGFSTIGKVFHHHNTLEPSDVDYACKPLDKLETSTNRSNIIPIILIDRGSCSFVTKVRNVQNMGGKIALIVNNQEDDEQIFGINDDGTGNDILIPGILISKKDGQKIKEHLLKVALNSTNEDSDDIILNIDNSIDSLAKEKVDLNLNFISNDKKIYKLLYSLKENKDILAGNNVNFTPYYVTLQYYKYNENSTNHAPVDHCFCSGRYCAYTHNQYKDSFLNTVDSEAVLTESVRQKCLYKLAYQKYNSHEQYWGYMDKYYLNCLTKNDFNLACSRNIIKDIDQQLLFDVEKCYLDSFVNKDNVYDHSTCIKNSLLEEDRSQVANNLKAVLPIIKVNDHVLYGTWNNENVLEALCANVMNKPDTCYTNLKLFEREEPFSYYNIIVFGIIFIVFNLFLVIVCRRYAMKKTERALLNDYLIDRKVELVVNSFITTKKNKN